MAKKGTPKDAAHTLEAARKLKAGLSTAKVKAKVKARVKPGGKKGLAKKPMPKKPVAKKLPASKAAPRTLDAGAPPLARVLERVGELDGSVLDRLAATVLSRRTADPAVSHSARLMSRGTAKVAQKFGEEAVECLIEAVSGDREALVAESADVLYHLVVLWVNAGVTPGEVWAELHRREGISGIAEKARRKIVLPTTKIP